LKERVRIRSTSWVVQRRSQAARGPRRWRRSGCAGGAARPVAARILRSRRLPSDQTDGHGHTERHEDAGRSAQHSDRQQDAGMTCSSPGGLVERGTPCRSCDLPCIPLPQRRPTHARGRRRREGFRPRHEQARRGLTNLRVERHEHSISRSPASGDAGGPAGAPATRGSARVSSGREARTPGHDTHACIVPFAIVHQGHCADDGTYAIVAVAAPAGPGGESFMANRRAARRHGQSGSDPSSPAAVRRSCLDRTTSPPP
jgi:hypothetical protein